jgi:hypothetical protein
MFKNCRCRSFGRLRLICLFVLVCSWVETCVLAQGEFDVGLHDVEEAEEQEQGQFNIGIENFDRWVFGHWGTRRAARSRLQSHLSVHIDAVDRVCDLTEAQQEKLRLAGQGDIWQFFNQVEEVRKLFLEARHDRQQFNQVWQHIQPVQQKLQAGLFHSHSLMRKCARGILEPEQKTRYLQQELERRKFHYQASIALTLEMLKQGIPLRQSQQQQLVELIHHSTELPTQFGQFDCYLILWKLSKLPKKELKPIFDNIQWRAMQQAFRKAQAMQPHLKKMGLLP